MSKASTSLAGYAKKLVSIYHSRIANGSFAAVLGSSSSTITEISKTGSSFQFVLPERLTLNKKLSASVALAIFDDLSTIGVMGADSCNRPGVSVHLNTHLLVAVPPGTDLTLNCKIDKIGKVMGFTSMQLVLTKSPHTVVAVGTHIKYLPLGSWIMDWLVMQPAVLKPMITYGLFHDGTSIFSRMGLVKPFIKKILFDPRQNAFMALGLCATSESAGAMSSMTTKVHQALCNPLSSMHGGAVGMAAEFASQCKTARPDDVDPEAIVTEIDITYLSALTGEIIVEASPDNDAGVTRGVVRKSNSSNPAAQFSLKWGSL